VTQQNAALVEESSAAAQALTEQASTLTQLIARYQVGQDSGEQTPRAAAPAREPVVEGRAPIRPMTSKRKPTVSSAAPAVRQTYGAAAEDWKDF
jgi:methyl-accepting chemotaxis protein